MRHLLVALLIALLPLRGWVGDAMAIQMAATVAQSPVTVYVPDEHGGAARGSTHEHAASELNKATTAADCVGHTPSKNTSSSDTSHCESCVVCQACSSVALVLPSASADATLISLQIPLSAVQRFTSAERALGLKPPIS